MSNFDRIIASVPLNATAAKVTAQSSDSDEPSEWNTIPPIKRAPRDPSFKDLTGFSYGRLTVMGLHDSRRGNDSPGASWVVRCVCGTYGTRKTAPIKKANPDACCSACDRLRHAQWALKHHGSRPITDFFKRAGEAG